MRWCECAAACCHGDIRLSQPCLPSQQAKAPPLRLLQQRSWLLHWSLYVHFNHEKGPEDIINLFLYEQE